MSRSDVTQQPSQRPVGDSLGKPPARSTVLLAWAGIIGPVLFTAAFLAQEAFLVDGYSPLAEPVSALEAQPHGWVQQINFVVFGLLTIAFAVGLRRGLQPTRAGAVGPALFVVSGVGLLGAAIFPLRKDAGVTYQAAGHVVAGTAFFLGSALALILVSRRLARDPRWRSLATYTLAAGVATVAGGVVMNVLVIPDDAPLHDFAGLVQRLLVLVVLFPCRMALSLRLLRVTSGDDRWRRTGRGAPWRG
jgi:hypothetical membrane protein